MAGKRKQRIYRDTKAEARKVCDARGFHRVSAARWGLCIDCKKFLMPEDRIGRAATSA
jgi:hypothetical protein